MKISLLQVIKYAARFAKKARLVEIVVLAETILVENPLGAHAMDSNKQSIKNRKIKIG